MKYIQKDHLKISRIGLGCMRIGEKTVDEVEMLVKTALDNGINFFDHADIYGNGNSEKLFGEVLKRHPDWRKHMVIQTKCGVRRATNTNYYDFSKEYIIKSVDGSLKRLGVHYIDILLLHRPDLLMDPKEVADAFNTLYESGKVKYFGVSNMNSMQMALLQKHCKQKIMFNQLQFNPVTSSMLTSSVFMNRFDDEALDRDGSTLDYCRLHDITIQPYSILQISKYLGSYLDNPEYPELNALLQEYAEKYQVTKTAIVLAWILKHPADMVPLAGTTNPHHLSELCKGSEIELTREEWYFIYHASIKKRLP